jgi:hypothetical protein
MFFLYPPRHRSTLRRFSWAVGLALLAASATTRPGFADETDRIVVYPPAANLFGPAASQRLIVQSATGEDIGAVMPEADVAIEVADAQIARVEGQSLYPLANGDTTATIRAGALVATIPVRVEGMDQPARREFTRHVLPVLSKIGCNSGACHGALAGKGGLKLSLRGYDPASDHFVLTKEANGRRVELADPGRSLLLAKPSGALPHKGGLKFDVDSDEYRVLAEWISQGAPAPQDDDAKLTKLEIYPPAVLLSKDDAQPFVVTATYSDGRVEDVTRRTKFTSTNESVALIDGAGTATVVGHGGGAISAWFSSRLAVAEVTVPYPYPVPDETYAQAPRRNFIDDLSLARLKRMNLEPAARCDDQTFLRRVTLDLIGMQPTPEETIRFLDDPSPDKRDRLIDELLARDEFVDYWTYKWSDVLLVNGRRLRPDAVKAYYGWIREQVEQDVPWDEFARRIVTAQGEATDDGATNFYALHQDPETVSENVSQAFLGLSLACAKCHNHPLEKWTNDQYYAFANCFARVRTKGWGGEPRNGDGKRTLYVSTRGELIQPLTGKPQPPTPLDGEPMAFDDPRDRREALAEWLVSPENPYFARAAVNRVWASFFGVGLVELVDDLRVSNPASDERMLSALADRLVEHDFRIKELIRDIVTSETYQRSSEATEFNAGDERFYSRFYPRRLQAEVLHDVITQATGVPTNFDQIAFEGADKQKTDFYPPGTRAVELYDSAVESYFLSTFGRNPRDITCECERSSDPSLVQALHLINGETLNKKLADEKSVVTQELAAWDDADGVVDRAFLRTLCRRPTERELAQARELLGDPPVEERRKRLEDLYWSLTSSREFLFQR